MRATALVLLVALALAGCATRDSLEAFEDALPLPGPSGAAPDVPEATCPAGAANCAAATGRVVFVESVDPDGDGDLHVVVTGGSVTLPGLTVLDVRADLRPAEDPRIGDVVTGAGPVYPGSRGQRQIQVEEFRVVARR